MVALLQSHIQHTSSHSCSYGKLSESSTPKDWCLSSSHIAEWYTTPGLNQYHCWNQESWLVQILLMTLNFLPHNNNKHTVPVVDQLEYKTTTTTGILANSKFNVYTCMHWLWHNHMSKWMLRYHDSLVRFQILSLATLKSKEDILMESCEAYEHSTQQTRRYHQENAQLAWSWDGWCHDESDV